MIDRHSDVRCQSRRGDPVADTFRFAAISWMSFPEGVLEAHTGLVPPDAYGPFRIQRLLHLALHDDPMISVSLVARSQRQRSLRYVVPPQ